MPDKQLMKVPASHIGGKRSFRGAVTEIYRFLKVTPYAISIIWKFQPSLFIVLIFSTVLDGISPAVTVWVTRYLLDSVVRAYQHLGESVYIKKAIYMVILQVGVTGGFACISKSMSFFKSLLSSKLSLDMQTDVIDGMSHLEMKDYDDPEIYNMIERAKGEAQSNKPLQIVSGVCNIISNIITWFSFGFILFSFSPFVVAAMFAICIPDFILAVYYAKINFNLQHGRIHELRVANYLDSCFTSRRALPEIITLNLWSFLRNKWRALTASLIGQDISLLKRHNTWEIVIIVFTYISRGGVSLYIIVKCLLHFADYTIGQIMMFYQSFAQGATAAAQILQQFSAVYEGSCFLQTYQQFQEVQSASKTKTTPKRKIPEVIETIECKNISFIYPGASTFTLRHIDVLFKKGQSTLLVGRNGAGKTTLARLLFGLYRPTEGEILINGHDMWEYDLTLLREKMGIIFQDFVRYALTVEENIGLGSVERINGRERIINAAKVARLNDIITGLPNGYGTMLGKEFRDGQDLSLGEWQRVCLARLFMRDATVMIYDEPSASLDIETESKLLREIGLSGKNRICILISHRMLRADIAGRIIVMEKGEIVERGNHNTLVILGGRYARLWKTYHRLGNGGESSDDEDVNEYQISK